MWVNYRSVYKTQGARKSSEPLATVTVQVAGITTVIKFDFIGKLNTEHKLAILGTTQLNSQQRRESRMVIFLFSTRALLQHLCFSLGFDNLEKPTIPFPLEIFRLLLGITRLPDPIYFADTLLFYRLQFNPLPSFRHSPPL